MNQRLIAQNPWWVRGLLAFDNDKQLKAVAQAAVAWAPPLSVVDVSQDGVYTLRGQRQVGKSTLLKQTAKSLIEEGWSPRRVMYVDVEGANATRQGQLAQLIRSYLEDDLTRKADGARTVVLLDEVTGLKNWQTAIRVLADEGALEGVTVLATGSNCKDVKSGGDRLPRRRGKVMGRDLLYQPLSFRDYLLATDPETARAIPALDWSDAFIPERLHEAAQEAQLHGGRIISRFQRYLRTGGFLVSINEELANGGIIPEHVFQDYRAAVLGEVNRLNRRESVLRPVIRWLSGKLGEAFEWRAVAQETNIARHETIQDLIEDLESAYIWHILYRTKSLQVVEPTFKSPKRLYPLDPFTWHMLDAWSRAAPSAWEATLATLDDPTRMGKLAESVAVDHLRRHFGPHCFYYRTDSDAEIDVVGTMRGLPVVQAEVKYRNKIDGRAQAALRHHGGGILLSKDTLHFASAKTTETTALGPVAEVPIPFALAMWPCPTVFPSIE